MTADIIEIHGFVASEVDRFLCAICGRGWMTLAHRAANEVAAPPTVAVAAVLDLGHLVIGERLLINGDLCEVVQVIA